MGKNSISLADSVLNCSFVALVLSLGGCALLETWLLMVHANLRGQILAALPGLLLALISVRNLSVFRRDPFDASGLFPHRRRRFWNTGLANASFLFAVGALIGLVVRTGDLLLTSALMLALSFSPWSQIPFCRNHFFAACTMIWIGAGLTLFLGRHLLNPISLLLASWILLSFACVALLMRAEKLWRNRPGVKGMAGASE